MKSSRVALVTGSGRGIGRTIALQLAADGADIVVNFFRNRSSAEAVADEIRELGRKALVVKANVGNLEQLNELYDDIDNEFGRLDIMIHNAPHLLAGLSLQNLIIGKSGNYNNIAFGKTSYYLLSLLAMAPFCLVEFALSHSGMINFSARKSM